MDGAATRRFARFVLVGGLGFAVDAGTNQALLVAGWAYWAARLPAIGLAMLFTWLANRRFTYQVQARRSAGEGLRYAAVACCMAVMNYGLYLLLVRAGLPPLASIVVATALQTVFSFHAYRRFVFRQE